MKKIIMKKYGFVAWPERDFLDDGSFFKNFRAGKRVRVTKCVSQGEAYIHASMDNGELPFEICRELPHYQLLDRLNGVSIESLTDDDLNKFYQDCLAYEEEYEKALSEIKFPTEEEIKVKCAELYTKYLEEKAEVKQLLNQYAVDLIEALTEHEWTSLKILMSQLISMAEYYETNQHVKRLLVANNGNTIVFCNKEIKDSYYYKEILKLIDKVR